MSNNSFDGLEPIDFPQLDLSSALNAVSKIQAQMDENQRHARQVAHIGYEERNRMGRAMEQTAENTAQTNVYLQKVVENQNDYIDLLRKQLDVLRNIFSSGEAQVEAEKEIVRLIQEQIDNDHPLWDFAKDKGGDVAVSQIVKWLPLIWEAIKGYLISKGIGLS